MAQSAIAQHVAALSAAATPTIPAVPSSVRLVPALVGLPGRVQTVWIECPNWCVVDHAADRVGFVEDINHRGARESVRLSPSQSEWVPLEVFVSQWPASDDGGPYLAVDVDAEVYSYGRTAALAMADQLVAFAANVRRLAETLPQEPA